MVPDSSFYVPEKSMTSERSSFGEPQVYVLVGDGSYLMMSQEITTAVQEGWKINIIVLDNHGFSSIGGLSRACGSGGFGTEYRYRENGNPGRTLPVDFAANAASLGACALRVSTRDQLAEAIQKTKSIDKISVIVVETDYNDRVPGYESWWDVAIAEQSSMDSVQKARSRYEEAKRRERYYWPAAEGK